MVNVGINTCKAETPKSRKRRERERSKERRIRG